jgi:hypothetical protein
MTKVIERPMSTTHALEFLFHYIKDEQEAENVRKIIGDREVLQVHRGIDEHTFQPILYFAIPEKDKPFFFWMKYAAPMTIWVTDDRL